MAREASSLPFLLSQHFSWGEGVIKQPKRRPWKCADALEHDGAAQVQCLILYCNIQWFSNILIQHALLTIISRTLENNIWEELSQWSRQVVFFQPHKVGLCKNIQKLWIKKEERRGHGGEIDTCLLASSPKLRESCDTREATSSLLIMVIRPLT